jgi:hypothetical protein
MLLEDYIDSFGHDAKYWDEHWEELKVLVDKYYLTRAKVKVDVDYYEIIGLGCDDYETEAKRIKERHEFLEDCWD